MFETRKKKNDTGSRESFKIDSREREWDNLPQHFHRDVSEPWWYGRIRQEVLGYEKQDVRFTPNVVQLAPERNNRNGVSVNTHLDEQYGPSCWLFVLDAILQELGNEAPFHVAIGKFFYPDSKELKDAGGGRIKAIELAQGRIDTLIQRFSGIAQNPIADRELRRNSVERIFHGIFQDSKGWERAKQMLNYISDQELINVNEIVQRLRDEKDSLVTLKNRLENVPKNETDAEFILGTLKSNMGSNYGTLVSLKLDFMDGGFSLPLYMSVNRRFSPNESGKFDFSDEHETRPQTRGAHAILITNLQYGAKILPYIISKQSSENYYTNFSVNNDIWKVDDSQFDDGFVEYKDPNYGNEIIKIRWSQFMEMSQNEAGKDNTIFSFVSSKN